MPYTVSVVEYGDKLISEIVISNLDFLPFGNPLFPLLAGVDQYDRTIFNRLQVRALIHEWERIREKAVESGMSDDWKKILKLLELVQREPLRYLVFEGD